MPQIRKPAVQIRQGKRTLFLTSFCVRDFTPNFYRVDHLDVQEKSGMQRLLNKSRANSFGRDITEASEENEAFLPTSIFLATGGAISYDEQTKEIFFDSAEHAGVCPFDIVDGQHRIEGLRIAAEKAPRLQDFSISVVIAPNLSDAEKMLQFVTVNTKQQPVNQGVAQHIISRFTAMLEVEDLPYLPPWLKKNAEKGTDAKALDIARTLNKDKDSPWYNRIHFIDQISKERGHTINQSSFVKSVKNHILAKNHPLSLHESDKQIAILNNYWKAVASIFVISSDDNSTDFLANSVVFQYTGLEFFHSISAAIINKLAKHKNYTEIAIKECILSAQDYLPTDAAGIMSPEYWQRGNDASDLNRGGATKLASSFVAALAESDSDNIEV